MVLDGNNFAPARLSAADARPRHRAVGGDRADRCRRWPRCLLKFILPRRKLLISGRAIVFLMATLALGPGLLVNVGLKDHWGRPRPIDVTQFGGDQHFVAWWDPRGDCPSNCSFVSGDVSGAFWTLAPAALAPPPWRALAYGAALALGAGMAALRMTGGRAFLLRRCVCRRVHLFDHLDRAWLDLSLAAHAADRRGHRARRSNGLPSPAMILSPDCLGKRKTEL